MIRIPYPIPHVARQKLIEAGKESCRQLEQSLAKREAREKVEQITEEIRNQYGKECYK
jgi:hypothetical protein